jgi:AMP nucleosidase
VTDRILEYLSPEEAVARLETLHNTAVAALRTALARFVRNGVPPGSSERAQFHYPELRVAWQPSGPVSFTRRAWVKFQAFTPRP